MTVSEDRAPASRRRLRGDPTVELTEDTATEPPRRATSGRRVLFDPSVDSGPRLAVPDSDATGTEDVQPASADSDDITAHVPPSDDAAAAEEESDPAETTEHAGGDPSSSSVPDSAVHSSDTVDGAPGFAASGAESPTPTRRARAEGRRSSFAPSFPRTQTTPIQLPSKDADPPRGSRADDVNPATGEERLTERTMTRRELRALRARAEAAGQPVPDVVFLPDGGSAVTGVIDIIDLDAVEASEAASRIAAGSSEGQSDDSEDVAPEAIDDAAASGVPDVAADSTETETEPEPDVETEPDAEPEPEVEPVADAAGVVTEVVVGEEDVQVDSEGAPDGVTDPLVIPALIEPAPDSGPIFGTDSGRVFASELVVDAEPATGEVEVDASLPSEPASAGEDGASAPVKFDPPSDAPSPSSLRPFDALFRPSSDDGETGIDTWSARPVDDATGLRGDILNAPDGAARPFGHWSTQDGSDDELVIEHALSRDIGGTGAVTTHALVLPSIPDAGEPLLSPLTSTGEVMVTGIVELPRSYGSTGAHPALFDHPEVDALLDDADREDSDSGGHAPIRATRAVSSSASTTSMIGTERTPRSRVVIVAGIIIGGVVLVAAATWALAAFVFNPF